MNNYHGDKQFKILMERISDDINLVKEKYITRITSFLNPFQQREIEEILRNEPNISYEKWGGYEEAERQLFFIYNCETEFFKEDIVKVVRITWNNKYYSINHRDVLGAILGLGIKREKIGDIIIDNNHAFIFVISNLIEFITNNLMKVGQGFVTTEEVDIRNINIPLPDKKVISATVCTLRLDSLVSSCFGISRNKSVESINAGKVYVNWQIISKPSFAVKKGDVISLRGRGKGRIIDIGSITKKNRLNIKLERLT